MRNVADSIENFILEELMREAEALVQRNVLAQELNCAPSQISYVLSTRFTPERGFLVESRRGSGGFVRIVRSEPVHDITCDELLRMLHLQGKINGREARLLSYLTHRLEGDDDMKQQFVQNAVRIMEGR
ncbi:MAG: CtsR family transcriptional regulator [Phascolarctobacterium sp.]|nr:CtsR family transcriptional regulator [Candidatus Phascolarctobacterium caballi]MCQ2381314.1 CtsR family transcriptional regulator [Acidaminococcaceae bacterium]